MTMISLEKQNNKKLVGVANTFEREKSVYLNTHTNKHAQKRRGWISDRPKKGNHYYYYSWAQRNAAGDYPEHVEYLGTAELIRKAVNEYKANHKGGKHGS